MPNPCKLRRPCPCGSTKGLITPSGNMHPARLSCFECGRFLKWLNKSDADRARDMGVFSSSSPNYG
jgi:hypothetical protein